MEPCVSIAACALKQWAMDYDGNLARIISSIRQAKASGARIRLGPELEICGYGCNDHFFEADTMDHSWQVLREILAETSDILCVIGMPVMLGEICEYPGLYNCFIFIHGGRILGIRPKMVLAKYGNYREDRWFIPWRGKHSILYRLPDIILGDRHATDPSQPYYVPFGNIAIKTRDQPHFMIGVEICEELFSSSPPHIAMLANGVNVILNGSASHFQVDKLDLRQSLVNSATEKYGGLYVYTNLLGCDGERVYYDGCPFASMKGRIIMAGRQFSLGDMDMITLDNVSLSLLASKVGEAGAELECVRLDSELATLNYPKLIDTNYNAVLYSYEEQLALSAAAWMWDYLKRSGANGFFLPLSGGIDSALVALLVRVMSRMAFQHGLSSGLDEKALVDKILYSCYIKSELASSIQSQDRARALAQWNHKHHMDILLDPVLNVLQESVSFINQDRGLCPKPWMNLQAKMRMVYAYYISQSISITAGPMLVLGCSNNDEAAVGYLAKYDNSSADINPIGSFSKNDVRKVMIWLRDYFGNSPIIDPILEAVPSAELSITPTSDEQDLGLGYDEIEAMNLLRKCRSSGPISMLKEEQTKDRWAKILHYFNLYASNRHKMSTITPALHATAYSTDDNRFDLRPILYPPWSWQSRIAHRLLG